MKQYSKSQNAMGGLLKIWAIPINDIQSVSINNLSLIRTDGCFQLPIQTDSAEFVDNTEELAAGIIHNIDVSCTLLATDTDLQEIQSKLDIRKYALLILTSNEKYLMIGDHKQHLKPKKSQRSGRNTADLYSSQITFSAKLTKAPMQVQYPFTV